MPISPNALFHRPSLQKAVERHFDPTLIADLPQKRAIVAQWRSAIASSALQQSGEVALHGDFLIDIFARVLGYARQIEAPVEWQLAHEQKTLTDATKADGALGFFRQDAQDIRAVIELKSVSTDLDAKQHHKNNKDSAVDQAFAYAHKSGEKCQWIIVSNYAEIRLYHASFSGKCETFRLLDLAQEDEFRRFYFLLAREFLLSKTGESAVEALRRQSQTAEQKITEEFYAKYSEARRHLFEHLKQQNPQHGDLTLLACTQRLLDRFIFIYFCEDDGDLLPEKTFRDLIKRTKASIVLSTHYGSQKIWLEMNAFFRAMDTGLSSHQIPGFNGELFKPDALIDSLRIEDEMLIELAALSDYDFRSDLNVNILGHIFEQSISDLEELRAEIRGETLDRKQGKRKKEGVFYTPEYVTRYIVEQAVGGWLAERRRELGEDDLPELTPEDEAWLASPAKKKPRNERIECHIAFWEAYLEQLKQIAILDPACGSGAFLTQAFDFLMQEGEQVNRELNRLRRAEQLGLFSRKTWEKTVLRNNLFGVDLNGESVEITKLALWLKTAKKDDRLTALNDHIRCGNSLIDDPAVAGERAFDWAQAFPTLMERGGFDVVIGNPPYGASINKIEQSLMISTYHHGLNRTFSDTYVIFILLGLHKLLNANGMLGFIVPNTWLFVESGKEFRAQLINAFRFMQVVVYKEKVFADATVDCLSIFIKKSTAGNDNIEVITTHDSQIVKTVTRPDILKEQEFFNFSLSLAHVDLLEKIKRQSLLVGDYFIIKNGVKPYEEGKGNPPQTREIVAEKPYTSDKKLNDSFVPLIGGSLFHRYALFWNDDSWISYGEWLAAPRNIEIFQAKEKLIVRQTSDSIIGTFITNPFVMRNNTHIILKKDERFNLKYLLCLLNSRFTDFVYWSLNPEKGEALAEVKAFHLEKLVLNDISLNEQQPFVEKADKMLELNRQLHAATQKFTHFLDARYHPKTLSTKLMAFDALAFDEFLDELKKQKVALSKKDEFELLDIFDAQKAQISAWRQEIEKTDKEIDKMTYELYELTEDEIRLIEGT